MKLQTNCQSFRELRGWFEMSCFISKALIGLPACIWAVTLRPLLVNHWRGRQLLTDECLHPFYYLLHISSLTCLTGKNSHKKFYNYVSQPTSEFYFSVFKKWQQKQTGTKTQQFMWRYEEDNASSRPSFV